MEKKRASGIMSDGWSDSQRRPLINFMAISDSKPMFSKAIDFQVRSKISILFQIC